MQDYATDLLIDQAGRVWFGTSASVTVFDGQTWLTYTQADGLPPGAIKDIGVDPAGHVWLVTSTGPEFEFEAAYQCALGTAAYGRRGCSVRSPTGTVLGFAPQSKVRDRWVWAEGERDVQ